MMEERKAIREEIEREQRVKPERFALSSLPDELLIIIIQRNRYQVVVTENCPRWERLRDQQDGRMQHDIIDPSRHFKDARELQRN